MNKLSVTRCNLNGKRVLLRVDFNVPMTDKQVITDDTRIRATLPTINYCLEHGASRIVIISHLGRPKGKPVEKYSLQPVADRLAELIGVNVKFISDCVDVESQLQGFRVFLLENLRFHPGEEAGSEEFARKLSSLGDVYINDAFGAMHRPHASISKIVIHTRAAGLLVARELEAFSDLLRERIDLVVLGGAKVSDKLKLIENLIPRVDTIYIGGAMAFTFLAEEGKMESIGESLYDQDGASAVPGILQKARQFQCNLVFPVDFRCAKSLGDQDLVIVKTLQEGIPKGYAGFDIGPQSESILYDLVVKAKKVFWNGPMGVFEQERFSHGTLKCLQAMNDAQGLTIIGGGDTAAACTLLYPECKVSHVSTGGGAGLELLEGAELPGIAHLNDSV